MGRLTKDPEARSTTSGKMVTRYTLAVDRRRKKEGEAEADFFNCVTFDKSAEFASKHFTKGLRVLVSGRVQTGSYVNKDGVKIPTWDVIIDDQYFADGKQKPVQKPTETEDTGFMSIPDGADDEGLPFN